MEIQNYSENNPESLFPQLKQWKPEGLFIKETLFT